MWLILLLLVHVAAAQMVDCETTKGRLSIKLEPTWSPRGVERFLQLVDSGFYDREIPLVRCMEGFLCQFGYNSHEVPKEFDTPIADDDMDNALAVFKQGYVSFAGNGANSRTYHLFVTLGESISSLGTEPWETPIGRVTRKSFVRTALKWNTQYGDFAPGNPQGPNPQRVEQDQQAYLETEFPFMDYIVECKQRRRVKDQL